MATYYVATTGDNTNNGDLTHPWRTISYALGATSPVAAGDTILIRQGTYDELITVGKSGSAGGEIHVKAYPGEIATLRGVSGSQRILQMTSKSYLSFEEGLYFSYGFSAPGGVYKFPLIYVGSCNHITFKGIKIERAGWGDLNALAASPWKEYGLMIEGGSYVTIDGYWTRGLNMGAQFKGGGTFHTLKNSNVQYTRQSNITVQGDGVGTVQALLIMFNTFGYSAIEDGVQGTPFYDGSGNVDPGDDTNRGVILFCNTFTRCWENGIDMKGCSEWVIHGNALRDMRGSNDGVSGMNRSSVNCVGRGHNDEGDPHDWIVRHNIGYANPGFLWPTRNLAFYHNDLVWNNTDYLGNGVTTSYSFRAYHHERRIALGKSCILNNIFSSHFGAALALYLDLTTNHEMDIAGNLYANEKWMDLAPATDVTYTTLASWITALNGTGWTKRKEAGSLSVATHAAIVYKNVSATPIAAIETLDFTLEAGSPAIGLGQYITKTTSSGSATTWVTVENPAVFTDWYGRTDAELPPEKCFFAGSINEARTILEIDKPNSRIRVDTAITYTSGVEIYYGDAISKNSGSWGWLRTLPDNVGGGGGTGGGGTGGGGGSEGGTFVATRFQFDARNHDPLPATNYPKITNLNNRLTVEFADGSVNQSINWSDRAPIGVIGPWTAKIIYCASAATGVVRMGMQVEAITPGDAIDIRVTDSFDTANTVQATVPATVGYPQELTIALNAIDNLLSGDLLRFKLFRDIANAADTVAGSVYVYSVEIQDSV